MVTNFERWQIGLGIGSLVVAIAAFTFVALQLRLLKVQISLAARLARSDAEQRRRQATVEFSTATMERQFQWRRLMPNELDGPAVEKYRSEPANLDPQHRNTVIQEFLGFFEELATGVNTDVYDLSVVDGLMGVRVVRAMANYGPWIKARRVVLASPTAYAQFEKMAGDIFELRRGNGTLPGVAPDSALFDGSRAFQDGRDVGFTV